jgi:polyisoprenoid-binding protein YceI
MKSRLVVAVLGILLALPAAAAPENYVADPEHTISTFEAGHFGFSWVRGRFNKNSAKVVLDREAKKGSVEAVIDTTSIDTGHQRRDDALRSENYLNVAKFPTITFRSQNLKFSGDNLVGADGDLTIMGVTRPVSLDIVFFKCGAHPANKREMCGADARATIKRSEFGVKRGANSPMNDEVKIAIQIEVYKE